jgi:transcriptional regulator with XRE-family HTH domain
MMAHLGQRIRRYRQIKGLTLEELARRTNTSKAYIWELESKPDKTPSLRKLEEIADALGVGPDLLLREDDPADQDSELEQLFIAKYRRLPRQRREKLNQLMDILVEF